jgi:hypothetical protein
MGDAVFNLYLLEHTYKYASGQDSAFWTAGFFYPNENVVAYSDCFIGSSVFYIPFRVMGFDRETAFQCWIVAGFALNFLAMVLVLDRVCFHWPSAAVGAAVFAFAPVQIAHLGHIQLLYRMPMPLAWYFLDRFMDEYRPSSLALALLFISWQFYMSMYLGYFLCLFLCAYIIAILAQRKKSLVAHYLAGAGRRARLWHAGLLAIFGAGLYPLYAHYSAPMVYRNSVAEVLSLLPRPIGYLTGSRGQLIEKIVGGTFAVQSPYPWEQALFVGLLPWVAVLAMTSLALARTPLRARVGHTLFAFWGVFLLTLSVAGVSAYQVVMKALPASTGIRTMARVVFVLLLPFACLTAAAFERLFAVRRGLLTGRTATLIALAACVAFGWETGVGVETLDKRYVQDRVHALESTVPNRERRARVSETGPVLAALWLDKSVPERQRQLEAMLAAQDLNIATLNGYSRFLPAGFQYVSDCRSLADMLLDYRRILPRFSVRRAIERIVIAPKEITCQGQFDDRKSRSLGPLPDDAYRALIAPKCLACGASPGATLSVLVEVTNQSECSWPQDGISLSTRFVRANDGRALSGFDNRFPVGTDFAPHESKQYVLGLRAPAQEGDYRLQVDLVQEFITWFSSKGTKRGELAIRVAATGANPLSSNVREVCGSATLIGFQPPEPWGLWSSSPVAEVRLATSVTGDLTVRMTARKLAASDGETLKVRVGDDTKAVPLSSDMQPFTLEYHLRRPADEIEFSGITPRSPLSLGLSSDPRLLGVGIEGLDCRAR